MDTKYQQPNFEEQEPIDPEKDAKRRAFAKRIEDAVRQEKRALVVRETAMSVLSPITSILAPWTGHHAGWLGGFITARQASDFGNQLKNLQESTDYRRIQNKLFMEFASEANDTMPEVERDAKPTKILDSSIRKVANEAVRYIGSKTAVIGGISGVAIAVISSTVPTLMKAATLGMGGVISSLGTIGGITAASAVVSTLLAAPRLRSRREINSKFRQEHMKEWGNVERKRNTLLANPALTKVTQSFKKKLLNYANAVQKEDSVLTRAMKAMIRNAASISIPSLLITAGVGAACYLTGIRDIASVGTVVMSANVLNNSLKRISDARMALKERADSMYDNYQKFSHNNIYTIVHGNEKAPENTDCIRIENPCYHLRDTDPESKNVGYRNPAPLIQSDGEVIFRPGFNLLSGASGAGKSTLYGLLRHSDDLSMGSISYGRMVNGKFQGVEITDMPKDEPYKHVAFGFQEIEHDDQTALEIIQQGTNLGEKEIKKAAELIDLPLYEETNEGTKPKQFSPMSGGEKKRVLFLQALLSDKPILIIDEPTSGVDKATVPKMFDLLNGDTIEINGVQKKRTIIYTTHNPDELRQFNIENIVQGIDMAPTQNADKIESFVEKFGIGKFRFPTEINVYPCHGKEDLENYIDLISTRVSSHNPDDIVKEKIQRQNAWQSIRVSMEIAKRQQVEQEQARQSSLAPTESDKVGISGRLSQSSSNTKKTDSKILAPRLLQQLSGKGDIK